ncbi:MAG: hypothetical protein RM049_03000 [Nostoc sp. DedQUE04]|uniref:hypothetical protein n=1 Tax=Nostoc sp. DedQUE04 TaxID=3075390 RepID=UPI002AD1FD42|nr:hypothetical protein [Nostoc sp. DedQUE04]MDZ8134253.1 hypothetical protein [Nostoc sp. DedQUE04]
MLGGSGHDTFVLGDVAESYYDNKGGSDVSDAGLIVDFNPDEDFIQLKKLTDGSTYVVAPGPNSTAGNEYTTDILISRPNQPLELIASVQSVKNLNLNDSYFVTSLDGNKKSGIYIY